MNVLERLAEWGGCARCSAIAHGPGDLADLRALLECGAVTRPTRGLYVIPGTSSCVVAARRASGLLTCASAAGSIGLPLLAPPALHLALPGHAAAPRAGLPRGSVLHWESALTVSGTDRGILAPLPVVLAHVLRCPPAREAITIVDAAVNRRLIALEDLAVARPRAGKVGFDRLLRAVDGRSQSLPETFARLALRSAGFWVEPQVQITDVGWVDLLVEDLVVVELDGFAYHGDRRQFREDRRRDRALALLGVPVLRYTFEDTVHGVARLVGEVDALVRRLRRAGRRPIDDSLRRGASDW